MNILGISCHYHDSAACLVSDGKVISAAQEERFNREKNSSAFPLNSINYCLQEKNITINEIDYIVFYEKPFLKFHRTIINHLISYPFSIKNFIQTMPHWLEDRLILPLILKDKLGYEGKVLFIKHHLAHAASSFLVSPFNEAVIITSDGVGEFATLTLGFGKENKIKITHELQYPNSLGLLYSAITSYLGFQANRDEGKIMALADYGKPMFINELKDIIDIKSDGSFWINQNYFGFNKGSTMYSKKFVKKFGNPRTKNEKITQRHKDIAATFQKLFEDILIKIINNLYKKTKSENLCCAGGTFLNCVANSKILEKTPFKNIYIQPGASDCGGALGAAIYVYNSILNNKRNHVMTDAYLGPEFSQEYILRFLINNNIKYKKYNNYELVKNVAKKISENNIVGWFQGRMEFGPRALGHRSILANPCNPNMKDLLNAKVKHRETFRPYGISILYEDLTEFFELNKESPFMLLTAKVKKSKKRLIPSALHINGSSRIQTVTKKYNGIYYDLIQEFKKITKIPLIINTSFNNNEPIICNPEEAYNCFKNTKMDYLILGNYLIEK